MTMYYLREVNQNLGKEITIDFNESINFIKKKFDKYSTENPQIKYKILKKETVTSTICESENSEQFLFSFV